MSDSIDTDRLTFLFERTYAASAEAVFDAWTKPDQVTQWWDPSGKRLVSCTIDLRPKGAFRFETDGHAPPFEGTYVSVERPRRLVFEAMGAVGTVAIAQKGAQTHLSVTIQSPSREHFEMFMKLGVNEGTAQTLNNLGDHVTGRRQVATR